MQHTVKALDDQLNRLDATIGEMGRLAGQQFDDAIDALVRRDPDTAKRVIDGDAEIDRHNESVDHQVINLLALRAPVANDLRLVVAALKIANDLERVGDYAANIAKRSLAIANLPQGLSVHGLTSAARIVHRLIDEVMEAFRDRDAGLAIKVWEGDREVDDLYSSLFRELLTYMMEDPRSVAQCSHLLFIAKNIERIGDLATNIGEMVHYAVTGHEIDGLRPKGEDVRED